MKIRLLAFFLLVICASFLVFAHSDEPETGIEAVAKQLEDSSVKIIVLASIIVGILVLVSVYTPKKTETLNWVLFLGITIPTVIATVYVTGTTIFVNVISETGGPVHWHADFEIWNCDQSVDPISPKGLLNRIGTSEYHEHNDFRVHVEGTIINLKEIDLDTFFEVIGGKLEKDYLAVPTDDGLVEITNRNTCNGKEAKLQAFVYKVTNPNPYSRSGFKYTQFKIENFEEYILSPYINVPPGDCIIIEFDEEKDQTDKICESFRVAEQRGDIERE